MFISIREIKFRTSDVSARFTCTFRTLLLFFFFLEHRYISLVQSAKKRIQNKQTPGILVQTRPVRNPPAVDSNFTASAEPSPSAQHLRPFVEKNLTYTENDRVSSGVLFWSANDNNKPYEHCCRRRVSVGHRSTRELPSGLSRVRRYAWRRNGRERDTTTLWCDCLSGFRTRNTDATIARASERASPCHPRYIGVARMCT